MHTHTRRPLTTRALTKRLLNKGAKAAAVLGLAGSLSGCIVALPPAVQFASLALDGISYLSTGKSVTDHAISGVTQQDCAMLRPLKGETICSDTAPQPQYAMLPDGTPAPNAIDAADGVESADEDEDFQAFAAVHAETQPGGTGPMDLDEILSDQEIQAMELDMQTASGPDEPVF